jgi:hypothetical protein
MVLHRGACSRLAAHVQPQRPSGSEMTTWVGQQQPADDHGTCCALADIAVQVLAAHNKVKNEDKWTTTERKPPCARFAAAAAPKHNCGLTTSHYP